MKSNERLLQAMRTILAWHSSCRHIFQQARRSRSKSFQWRLFQFRYHDDALSTGVFDLDMVLPLLRAWQGPSQNPYGTEEARCIIHQAHEATIHAEAALMHWIATVKVRHCFLPVLTLLIILQDVNSTQDWPIGVNNKCCQLCWLLHLVYNNQRSTKFQLPGTHGTFFPWLPPPGLPDTILIALRQALLDACKINIPSHSEFDPTTPVKVVIDVPNLHRLKDAFMRLQRGGAEK